MQPFFIVMDKEKFPVDNEKFPVDNEKFLVDNVNVSLK